MRQAALTLGSAPDCGTFIYTLKVPHTHPPMPKSKGLTRPGFAMQSYIVIVSFTRDLTIQSEDGLPGFFSYMLGLSSVSINFDIPNPFLLWISFLGCQAMLTKLVVGNSGWWEWKHRDWEFF